MFYKLKTGVMKRAIAKKQKAKPFDLEAAERFALDANADPSVNNSYYFSAHGANGESFYCRLGLRSVHSEVWFYYTDGKERYTAKTMLYEKEAPLTVEKSEDGWKIAFRGELTRGDGAAVSALFAAEFTSTEAPVDFFSDMPPARTARALAGEKWSRAFFAEVQSNNQVHYEQAGRLKGALTLDGAQKAIDLPCVRDHSFGKRDWNYMNNHLWVMAVSETSQLNFSMVSYPAMSVLEVGNFRSGNDPMAYVKSASYDRTAFAAGEVPQTLNLLLYLEDGRRVHVIARKTDEETYLFADGAYRLTEGVADLTVNGERFRGILEVGYNRDTSRIFNGKDARRLKV